MKTLRLSSEKKIPVLGQGTWEMGDDASKRSEEIAALCSGIDLGMTLIDTAEMYGDGASEELVAEAIGNRRQEVFLVTKVLPQNASREGVLRSCEKSLERLKTDYLDLYLLHWKGSIPLEDTIEAFQILKTSGKIVDYGVSNFDVNDMKVAVTLPGGEEIATNQVLYNLTRRGIEWDLLPWSLEQKMPIMAYSPLEQGRLQHHPFLNKIAERHTATAAQIALAWVLQQQGVMAIPKASNPEHVRQNFEALDIQLTAQDLKELNEEFPSPKRKMPMEFI